MSLLNTVNTDENILNETDVLSTGFTPLDSGLYNHEVTLAYLMKSRGGALGLTLHMKDEAGREYRETLWVTSGNEKGNKTYYERNGERYPLPGYAAAESLCLLTVGKEFLKMDTEIKVVGVYNADAGGEVPTEVEVLVDLLGQQIISGIIKQKVIRTGNDGDREVEEAVIDKFFRASDRKTTSEIRAQTEKAEFIDRWNEKWEGQVRDRTRQNRGNNNRTARAGAMPGSTATRTAKPATSLFG